MQLDIDAPDQEIANFPDHGMTAILTSNLDGHSFNFDRGFAIGILLLKLFLGEAQGVDFKTELEQEILSLQQQRNQAGQSAFLIFRATGDADFNATEDEPINYGEDYGLCLTDFDKETIRRRFSDLINSVVTSLILFMDEESDTYIEGVIDRLYFVDKEGRIVYPGRLTMSVNATLARRFDAKTKEDIGEFSKGLVKDRELYRVSRLLAKSLQHRPDNLRSFLFVWTALEIFINQTYFAYEIERMGHLIRENSLTVSEQNFDKMMKSLKKSTNLDQKFIVISALLASDTFETDNTEFFFLKGERNKLAHGEEIADADLPTKRVQTLLRKFLRLHLSTKKAKMQ